jgi:hypothetical protein
LQVKHFVEHKECPNCGSKDNVGVWSDGQEFCFSHCGYFIVGHNGLNINSIRERLSQQPKKDHDKVVLPYDYSIVLREDASAWLDKYEITPSERFKHKIGWSELYESLVLPAYDIWGNLLVLQRRYFGSGKWPKYHTKGRPESCIWSVSPSSGNAVANPTATYDGTLVIVEDYVSAIKVGRQFETMPLWGSNLSNPQLSRIADRWQEIVFWLDGDKTKEAMQFRMRAAPFFQAAWVVSTEKDPKEYNDGEIREYLQQHVDA